MLKRKNKIILISVLMFMIIVQPKEIHADESHIEPFASLVPCSKSSNSLTKVTTGASRVFLRTPLGVSPYATLTVTQSYATTISNSTTITLVPDFLSMGYSRSFTAGVNIGWSKYNNTNRNRLLAIMAIYDVYKVISYDYAGDGMCKVINRGNVNIYKGWTFDFVD